MQSPALYRLLSQLTHHPLLLKSSNVTSPYRCCLAAFNFDCQTVRNLSTSRCSQIQDKPLDTSYSSSLLNVPDKPYQHSKQIRLQKIAKESDDPFIQDIVDSKNITDAVEIIEKYSDKIETNGVIIATDVLFNFFKKESSMTRKKEAANSVGMQKLFAAFRKKGRHMDSGGIISGVKLLSLVGVIGSDTTLQVLLKLLTQHANSLDPFQIAYLHFLLGKMSNESKSPLSTALEYALPVVFESQINSHTQLETESVQNLCDYLFYATKYNISDNTVQTIVTAIQKNADKITPKQALSVIWSFGDVKRNELYQQTLIEICFKKIADNLDSFELNELSTTIGKASRKYMKKVACFYNEDFLAAFCNKFMSRYVDPLHTLWSFKYLSLLRYVHVEYMDRVGEIIASRPTEVLNNDILFLNLVRSFSGCNYKPEKWSKFEAMFLDHPALTKDLGFADISLAVDFLALDSYPEILLHNIFSPEQLPRLDTYLQRTPFTSAHNLVLLYNAVRILYPEYSGPLPPISMIEKWKELTKHTNTKKNYLLKNALQTGFGGENYVINGVYHDGLHIDHAIVLRKGGFAIAVNAESGSEKKDGLAEIQKPAESVIILVKVFYKEAYSNNTNRLRGVVALEQKIIEKIGHPVVAVDAERWLQLPDHEKIPFLMHRIKEKIEKFQWNQSSSDVIPT